MSNVTVEPQDPKTGHAYDGIEEYDNPTPSWWTWLFIGTVVFSAIYFVYYHAGAPERSIYDGYEASVTVDLKKRFAGMGELTITENNLVSWMGNEDYLKVGKSTYKSQCVSCHGGDGEGLVGPNLTDGKYKNVKKLAEIANVIKSGANNGAMPAWSTRLHPNEVALVSAYVAGLRGKNLPGKSIEGEVEIAPWPTAAETQASKK